MPRYDVLLITRAFLPREKVVDVIRRAANCIFVQDGIIRKMYNMGEQELPYRMKASSEWHTHGQYFLFDVHLKPDVLTFLKKELRFDIDIIRPTIIKTANLIEEVKKQPKIYECTVSYQKPFHFNKR